MEPDIEPAEKFYEAITLNTLHGHIYTADERREIDRLLKARKRLLKRVAEIDSRLLRIQTEGVAIKKHCTASADEISAEALKHAKQLHDAECLELGMRFAKDAAFRRKVLGA